MFMDPVILLNEFYSQNKYWFDLNLRHVAFSMPKDSNLIVSPPPVKRFRA